VLDNFESVRSSETSERLRARMLRARLSPENCRTYVVFDIFGKTLKSTTAVSQPADRLWLRRFFSLGFRHERRLGQIWHRGNRPLHHHLGMRGSGAALKPFCSLDAA